MLTLTITVLGHLATFSSLVALYLTVMPLGTDRPNWHWLCLVAACVSAILIAFADIRRLVVAQPRVMKTQTQTRNYMKNWLSTGGRALSLSRDLSWVDDANEKVLLAKARKRELTLLVERPTALTNKIEKAGGEVFYYGSLGYVPLSRFTIIDYERDGARVAVGTSEGDKHVITELRRGHHPMFALAEDLSNVLKRATK